MHMLIAILMYFGLYTDPGASTQQLIDPSYTLNQQLIQYYQSNPDALYRLVRIVDRRED
jgi:hypothetical protein